MGSPRPAVAGKALRHERRFRVLTRAAATADLPADGLPELRDLVLGPVPGAAADHRLLRAAERTARGDHARDDRGPLAGGLQSEPSLARSALLRGVRPPAE